MLDILIRGALVIDGTGAEAFRSDIGILEGKILINPEETAARKTIDAAGRYLCPGFIDAHSHGDLVLGQDFARLAKISQGITTEITGQCGETFYPAAKEHLEELKGVLAGDTGSFPEELGSFVSFEKYAEYVEKLPLAVNLKILTGHSALRTAVMGVHARRATKKELTKMQELLEEAMFHGSLGLSTGLIYPPSCFADTEELIALARVAASYGGIYATHIRNESYALVEAVKEALFIGREAGIPVWISHHKAMGRKNWGLPEETLKLIDAAVKEGQQVTLDQYPYLAAMTNINAIIPPKYFEGGVPELKKRLRDPRVREAIRKDILDPEADFENQYLNSGGWDNIIISSLASTPEYNGMTFAEAGRAMGKDPFSAYFDLLLANDANGVGVFFNMCEADLCRIFACPYTVVGSDGICRSGGEKSHPRSWGTFPRAINYYHKEKQLFTLEEIIRKCTLLPAQRVMLENKGAIKDGWDADIVIFDYAALRDRANYRNSNLLCDGIEYVIVNGEIAYHDKKLTGANPGRLIRHHKI